MTQLIPLHSQTIDGNAVETVNARELHAFLEVRSKFADWIKNRISEYDFTVNQDFTTVSKNLENGGRSIVRFHKKMEANNATLIEYHITLDMAKELSMVERNEQGKQARKYFIECEKRLQATAPRLPTTYLEALEALLASEKEKLTLEQQASINAPKVAHYDRVVARTNLVNATHVASKLKLSAVKLNRHLCELGVYNQAVKRGKVFNTWFIDKGYGQMKQTELGYDQALFTHAGEMWVIEMMISEGVVG